MRRYDGRSLMLLVASLCAAGVLACGSEGDDDNSDASDTTTSGPTNTSATASGPANTSATASTSMNSSTSSAMEGSSSTSTTASASNGSATDSGAGGSSTVNSTTGQGSDCEQVSCLRPYECAESCDSPIIYSGCCPCGSGLIDQFVKCGDAGDADCGGASCSADEYCAKPVGQCAATNTSGNCTLRPDACTRIYDPVCGCDGQTYGNACEAAAAGVNVSGEGDCST